MVAGSEPVAHPPYYPHGGTYADLLAWHLKYWGTRPGGSTTANGQPWDLNDFRLKAFSIDGQDAARTGLNNWLGAKGAPNETNHSLIQQALFGGNPIYDGWRDDLENARRHSPKGKNQSTRKYPEPPPVVKPPAAPFPRPTPHFVGRGDEVEGLARALALEGATAILIQGGPGIGKTELTKAIADHADVTARFGEHRLFVRLETATTAAAMQDNIIRTIGCDAQYGLQAALSTLRGKQTLLLLDNLETPWEPREQREAVEQTLADLAIVPDLAVLASFRGRELVGGLRWIEHAVEALPRSVAIELFASVAGQWVQDDPLLDNFVDALGGIPLAVVLVARRAYGRTSLGSLWREWERQGPDFAIRPHSEAVRLASLSRSIELSVCSLQLPGNETAFRLLRLLASLPNGIWEENFDQIIGSNHFDAVERLLKTGLAFDDRGKLDLLPPIREYVYRYHKLDSEDTKHWSSFYVKLTGSLVNFADGIPRDDNPLMDLTWDFDNVEASFRTKIVLGDLKDAIEASRGFVWLAEFYWRRSEILEELANACLTSGDRDGYEQVRICSEKLERSYELLGIKYQHEIEGRLEILR